MSGTRLWHTGLALVARVLMAVAIFWPADRPYGLLWALFFSVLAEGSDAAARHEQVLERLPKEGP